MRLFPFAVLAALTLGPSSLGCGSDLESLFAPPESTSGFDAGPDDDSGQGTGGSSTGGSPGTGGVSGTGGVVDASVGGGGSTPTCVPAGHDEDQDSVDDACDNCPTIPNLDQGNADTDEIGDLCEAPGLSDLLGTIARFDPWIVPTSEWNLGEFVLENDQLRIDDEFCLDCGKNAVWTTPVAGAQSVEVNFTYTTASYGYAGAVFAQDPSNPDSWWGCLLNRRLAGTAFLAIWNAAGGSIDKIAETAGAEPRGREAAMARRIRIYATQDGVACLFENEAGDTAEVVAPSISAFSGLAGMRVYDAHALFQSFVLYR